MGGVMASDLERDLKAMILPGAASHQKPARQTTPPPMPKPGMDVHGCFSVWSF